MVSDCLYEIDFVRRLMSASYTNLSISNGQRRQIPASRRPRLWGFPTEFSLFLPLITFSIYSLYHNVVM